MMAVPASLDPKERRRRVRRRPLSSLAGRREAIRVPSRNAWLGTNVWSRDPRWTRHAPARAPTGRASRAGSPVRAAARSCRALSGAAPRIEPCEHGHRLVNVTSW